jgi:hypothetical protein
LAFHYYYVFSCFSLLLGEEASCRTLIF